MKTIGRSMLIVVVFLVGCATGGAASQLASSANAQQAPPPARVPPGMPRWAYVCFKEDNPEAVRDRANRVGAEGWEMVASALSGGAPASSPIWCFRRPY